MHQQARWSTVLLGEAPIVDPSLMSAEAEPLFHQARPWTSQLSGTLEGSGAHTLGFLSTACAECYNILAKLSFLLYQQAFLRELE